MNLSLIRFPVIYKNEIVNLKPINKASVYFKSKNLIILNLMDIILLQANVILTAEKL